MEIKKKGVGSPVAAQDVTTPFLQKQIVVKEPILGGITYKT